MIYVCFTCKRDEPLLHLHYQAIKRIDKEAVINYILDESEAETIALPAGSKGFTTSFNRNGNLIGFDALKGILNTFKYISQLHGNQPIIKIDSDIILTDIEWLNIINDGEVSMTGISPASTFTCSGGCYALSFKCLCDIIDFIEQGFYWDTTGRVEDQVITSIASIVSAPFSVLIYQPFDAEQSYIRSCVFTREMYNRPEVIKRVKGWINCGDGIYTNSYIDAKLDVTQAKKRAMRYTFRNL